MEGPQGKGLIFTLIYLDSKVLWVHKKRLVKTPLWSKLWKMPNLDCSTRQLRIYPLQVGLSFSTTFNIPLPTLWMSVGRVLVVSLILTIAHASIIQSINGVQNSKHVPTDCSLKPTRTWKLDNSCSWWFTHYLCYSCRYSLFDSPRRYHARNRDILWHLFWHHPQLLRCHCSDNATFSELHTNVIGKLQIASKWIIGFIIYKSEYSIRGRHLGQFLTRGPLRP